MQEDTRIRILKSILTIRESQQETRKELKAISTRMDSIERFFRTLFEESSP